MKPYFNTTDRIHALQASARNWVGTPFVPHACIAGAGVDCVNLVVELYHRTGVWPVKPTLPSYTMDGGKHLAESLLLKSLDALPTLMRVDWSTGGSPAPGDLLCFTTSRVAHHTGIMLDEPLFIHALFSRVVTLGNLRDRTFARRLTAVYRPVEVPHSELRAPRSS